MPYEVQHFTLCQGWINTWTNFDDCMQENPTVFETRDCAQASLDEFLADELQSFKDGHIASPSDPAHYRIVEVRP